MLIDIDADAFARLDGDAWRGRYPPRHHRQDGLPLHTARRELPLIFRSSGKVDGNGQAIGLGRYVKPSDTGQWWIDANRLCQKFQSWNKGKPMCFELERAGANTIKWTRDNGRTGVARIGN